MAYSDDYIKLSKVYNSESDSIAVEEGIVIENYSFHSGNYSVLPNRKEIKQTDEKFSFLPDNEIEENQSFRYPLVKKISGGDSSRIIILLHGLNERNWDKYLPWAKSLCLETLHPVILFPISFHMNRSPKIWNNPRSMTMLANQRKQKYPDIRYSTFVNAAISERLQQYPQRFFFSGLETYFDLLHLIKSLKNDEHHGVGNHPEVDFFGYSIGALLTEILLMSNPEERLSASKAFLFCGGTTLDKMNGVSKFILDSKGFESVRNFFVKTNFQLNLEARISKPIKKLSVVKTFRSMVNSLNNVSYRNQRLSDLKDRLQIYSLKNDKVIPSEAVIETFSQVGIKTEDIVHTLDFNYTYSHETPFPCLKDPNPVNKAFDMIFKKASEFLK